MIHLCTVLHCLYCTLRKNQAVAVIHFIQKTYTCTAGLEVKLTRTEEKRFFSFAWAPFCDSPLSLDWLGLADHQVNYDHIQLHKLQPDKSLSFVLSTFGSLTSTRALLLVNTYDSYELDEQFRPKSEGPCLPVMVVTKETGAGLLGFLKQHGRDVEVKVHEAGSLEEGEGEPDDWEVIPSLPPQGIIYQRIICNNLYGECLMALVIKLEQISPVKFPSLINICTTCGKSPRNNGPIPEFALVVLHWLCIGLIDYIMYVCTFDAL